MRTIFLSFLLACGGKTAPDSSSPDSRWSNPGPYPGEIPLLDAAVATRDAAAANPTSGQPPPWSADDAAAAAPGVAALPFDAAPDGACPRSLAPGDLIIDELMIESLAGTGDYGEWIEARSTRDCAIDLRGLHGECPRRGTVAKFDIIEDLWIPPGGTFVIADSASAAINHDLPGDVVVWSGQPGDVLRNKGTTVTLRTSGAIIDTVTYPALALTVGASLAFPSDCAQGVRSDWTRWQTSTASWFPGFSGTPNAPNVDVHCP